VVLQVCEGVVKEAPTDDQVLSILAMVYKSNQHLAQLTSAYEAALKARPNDARLLNVLLCMYTR
jgi:Tfp pilus assembly protein PilF